MSRSQKQRRRKPNKDAAEVKRITLLAKRSWHRLGRHESPFGLCQECRNSGLDWSRFVGRDPREGLYFDLSVMYAIKLNREDLIPESGHFGMALDGQYPIPEDLYDEIDW